MSNGSPSLARKHVVAVHGADARTLLNSSLPIVLQQLNGAEIQQLQKVLDSFVINPAVRREYEEQYSRSVAAQSGALVMRDPDKVSRANHVLDRLIPVTEADKHIRLDADRLLTKDALAPVTDNADEFTFLQSVKNTIKEKGIWLMIGQPPHLVRNPEDPSQWIVDPGTPQVWLTVDYDGAAIPTKDGRLDRDALIENGPFATAYYRRVIRGRAQRLLEDALQKVDDQIDDGEVLHQLEADARREAVTGVPWIVDHVGGARFPDFDMWQEPNQLIIKARQQNLQGNIKESSKTVLFAAFLTEACAIRLQKYIEATTKGVERVTKVLNIVHTVSAVVGSVFLIRSVFLGLVRYMAVEGAVAESGTAGASLKAAPPPSNVPEAYYPTNLKDASIVLDKTRQTMASGEFGAVLNRYDAGFEAAIKGAHAEHLQWLLDNPNASLAEKLAQFNKTNLKWFGDERGVAAY